MLLVAITGMPGAGKSTVAMELEKRGYRRIVMGDVVRDEVRRRGLDPDSKNTGKVMLELREEHGPGAVAELCLAALKKRKDRVIVVDGVRSYAEVEVFARKGKVKLLAVHASRDRRFRFLSERGRKDAPSNRASFDERDMRELSVGVGGAVALADECLSNEHTTEGQLVKSAVKVVEAWVGEAG